MKNEKGVTLIELLVALTLLTVILFLGFQLSSSIRMLWGNTINQFHYKNQTNSISSTLNRELEDPVALFSVNGTELRFETFNGEYKSLIYKNDQKSLWLYENTTTTNLENFSYDDGYEINDNIIKFSIKDEAGNTISSTGMLPTKNIDLIISVVQNYVTKDGESHPKPKVMEFPIKTIN